MEKYKLEVNSDFKNENGTCKLYLEKKIDGNSVMAVVASMGGCSVTIDGGLISGLLTIPINQGLNLIPVIITNRYATIEFSKPALITGLGDGNNRFMTLASNPNGNSITFYNHINNVNIFKNLKIINFRDMDIAFELLLNLPVLEVLIVEGTNIFMDLSKQILPQLMGITSINAKFIYGELKYLPLVTYLFIYRSPIFGNLSDISANSVVLQGGENDIRSNISGLNTKTKLESVILSDTLVHGDLAQLPVSITSFIAEKVYSFTFLGNGDKIWTSITDFNVKDNTFSGIQLDNLINCLSKSALTSASTIRLKGARTAVSDSAVLSIKSSGCKLWINGTLV